MESPCVNFYTYLCMVNKKFGSTEHKSSSLSSNFGPELSLAVAFL